MSPTKAPPKASREQRAAKQIDPRIRARRHAVQRRQGIRRLRILLGILGLGALFGLGWFVVQSFVLDVNTVAVEGSSRVTTTEVVAASGISRGDAILLLDTNDARRGVEKLTWVLSARVTRNLFGRVNIEVKEREPVAAAATPSGKAYVLIDATGRVLDERRQRPLDLPEIAGVQRLPDAGTWHAARDTLGALNACPETLRKKVARLSIQDGALVVELRDGTQIRFGTAGEQVRMKAAAAQAVLDRLGDRKVGYIDVRVPEAPVTGTL